ncbi:hypothetical protein EP331_11175 [bacterium]|nr:MAG: hypothetical protein EP331_11175 [bacterium]
MYNSFVLTRFIVSNKESQTIEHQLSIRKLVDLFQKSEWNVETYKKARLSIPESAAKNDQEFEQMVIDSSSELFPFRLVRLAHLKEAEIVFLTSYVLESQVLGNWFIKECKQADSEQERAYLAKVYRENLGAIQKEMEINLEGTELLDACRKIDESILQWYSTFERSPLDAVLITLKTIDRTLLDLHYGFLRELLKCNDVHAETADLLKEIKVKLEAEQSNGLADIYQRIDDVLYTYELTLFFERKGTVLGQLESENDFKAFIRNKLQLINQTNEKRRLWNDLKLITDVFCDQIKRVLYQGRVQLCFIVQQFIYELGDELEAFTHYELEASKKDEWIAIAKAATLINCDPKTIKNKMDKGILIGRKVKNTRRVSFQSVKKYLDEFGAFE